MPHLEQLRTDHAAAVLAFELDNRRYFAASISDRGDAYYRDFAEHHAARLAEQDAGLGAYYVLVDDDRSVVGRINLYITGSDTADLGYRMAEAVAGRGLATTAVRELCELAPARHGLARLAASTSVPNVASQRVLIKAGFELIGPADPRDVGGEPGYRYERRLTGVSDPQAP